MYCSSRIISSVISLCIVSHILVKGARTKVEHLNYYPYGSFRVLRDDIHQLSEHDSRIVSYANDKNKKNDGIEKKLRHQKELHDFKSFFSVLLNNNDEENYDKDKTSLKLSTTSSFLDLPTVSVWRLPESQQWDSLENFDNNNNTSSLNLMSGYMLLRKLNDVQLPLEYVNDIEPLCQLHNQLHMEEKNFIKINTTRCPVFDIMIQMANCISTRLLISDNGHYALPFDIYSTETLGTRDVMLTELQFIYTLSSLRSIHLINHPKLNQRELLLQGRLSDFHLIEYPNCASVQCYGQLILEHSTSFWILESIQRGDNRFLSLEPETVDIRSIGLWITSLKQTKKSTKFNLHFLPLDVGPFMGQTTITPDSIWNLNNDEGIQVSVDLETGEIIQSIPLETPFSLHHIEKVTLMNDFVELIYHNLHHISFNFLEIPWTLEIEAFINNTNTSLLNSSSIQTLRIDPNSITKATLQLAYIGPRIEETSIL